MRPEILKWVKIVVLRTLKEKRLTHLDIDQLISAGNLGYSQSLRRFDPARGVKFKTFAEYRIKGAVLDEVRKMIGDERCKNKRPARVDDFDFDTHGDLGMSVETLEANLDVERFFNIVPLSERDRDILKCRVAGMNLREIGQRFGFSESRASQVLAQIKKDVFPWLKGFLGENFNLVEHLCPVCGYRNETASFSSAFDCEMCGSDIALVNGTLSLKPLEVIEEESENVL